MQALQQQLARCMANKRRNSKKTQLAILQAGTCSCLTWLDKNSMPHRDTSSTLLSRGQQHLQFIVGRKQSLSMSGPQAAPPCKDDGAHLLKVQSQYIKHLLTCRKQLHQPNLAASGQAEARSGTPASSCVRAGSISLAVPMCRMPRPASTPASLRWRPASSRRMLLQTQQPSRPLLEWAATWP